MKVFQATGTAYVQSKQEHTSPGGGQEGRVVVTQWRMKRLADVIISVRGSLFRDTSTGRALTLALGRDGNPLDGFEQNKMLIHILKDL